MLAAAVRCYQLGFASLWLDEALTIRIANLPLSELWVTSYDPTPPLYYTVIHFLLSFGHSEIALRIPSALFGLLTVVIIYLATRKLAGATAAFAAALILALSFHNIEYSQEARAYSLLGLCLSVSLLGLINLGLRWQDSCEGFTFRKFLGSGGALYAMGLIAALYTHNAAVFYWLCVQLFFLAWWVRPFKFSLPCIASWAAVNMAVLLLWTPWLLVSIRMIS
ncbi:MAG: glycosyltransferase family 39 protein, partial [Halioglobus sp.]